MTIENQNPEQHVFSLPVNAEIAFTDRKALHKQRLEKQQRKLLKRLSFLRPFLTEDEEIIQVTTACSPVSLAEQMLTGWIVFSLKRCLLVFTNRRIFHVPTKPNLSYRGSIAQIGYGDCASIAMKRHTLVVRYKSGKTEKFIYVGARQRKKIKSLLAKLPLEGAESPTPQRTHLCPRCTGPLAEEQFTCPHCGLEFKSRKKARKISILLPGGGYFYTRHPWLGLGDAIAETYLSVLVLIALAGVLSGAQGNVFALTFFLLLLGLEKALTVYHSNHFVKEFIPKDRQLPLCQCRPTREESEQMRKKELEGILSVR